MIERHLDRAVALVEGAPLRCVVSGSLRRAGLVRDPVVGDDVVVEMPDGDGPGRIVAVGPRRNRIARRAAGPRPVEQVIAANLDRSVAVLSAALPSPRWFLLDRHLVEAEASGIPALICVSKWDLAEDAQALDREIERYTAIGYPVVRASALTGAGMDALGRQLEGRTSVLVGKSGVGKSTLIQALIARTGGEPVDLPTAPVSRKTGKGVHTTSSTRMIPLPGGGWIVDTPGIREFGLWEIPREAIAGHFPEMRPYLDTCRFRSGCTHAHEPGCAVREAVREGRIDPRRYASFLRLIGSPEPGEGGIKHSAANERGTGRPAAVPFRCARCGMEIPAAAPGTAHRNHCPACLWSLHVDQRPGDRAAGCGGAMEPIAISVRPDGEWVLVHRCAGCGVIKANRIAGDDSAILLMSLAARPLARPPFPLDRLPATEGRLP